VLNEVLNDPYRDSLLGSIPASVSNYSRESRRFSKRMYDAIIQIRISPGKRLPRHGRIFLGAFFAGNPRVKQSVTLKLSQTGRCDVGIVISHFEILGWFAGFHIMARCPPYLITVQPSDGGISKIR
jgi:hypothetical protein